MREKLESRQLRQENVLLKRALNEPHAVCRTSSAAARRCSPCSSWSSRWRATNSTVLITGESGTGKELVAARSITSRPRDRPFVALNCGALAETLLESELFGHVKGRSPAPTPPKGLFEAPRAARSSSTRSATWRRVQVKLLRVLQEREIRPVGGSSRSTPMSASSPRPTRTTELVAAGRFREDLFYRLSVIPSLPPLRERREDIPLLAGTSWQVRGSDGQAIATIPGEAMALPRELPLARQHPRARERHRAGGGAGKDADHPGRQPAGAAARPGPASPAPRAADVASLPEVGFDLEQHVQSVERRYLAQALERAGGVQVRAAELLGMSFRSFRYYAKKNNLK